MADLFVFDPTRLTPPEGGRSAPTAYKGEVFAYENAIWSAGREPRSRGITFAIVMSGNAVLEAAEAPPLALAAGDVVLFDGAKGRLRVLEGKTARIVTVVADEAAAGRLAARAPAGLGAGLRGIGEPQARRLFNVDADNLPLAEIVPASIFFKHWHLGPVSVGLFKMARGEAGHHPIQINRHGEELAFQLTGAVDMDLSGDLLTVRPGEALSIPPYLPHRGDCVDDEVLLVSVFSPRRDEWGPETDAKPTLHFVSGEPAPERQRN